MNTPLGLWLRLAACERVCVFLAEYSVFLPCLWILRLAGCCTLLEEARRPKQNRRRSCIVAKSERQVDGVRVDSDIEALPKSALDNLVSERRYTDGQQVLGTQDEEVTRRAAVSKEDTENLQKVGQFASHTVLCTTSDVFRMVDTSRSQE